MNTNIGSSRKIILLSGLIFLLISASIYSDDGAVTRRFGIFIGSNNGGRDRVTLRYAVSDAKSLSRVFSGMGGIADADSILLVEPTIAEINRQLDAMGRQTAQAKQGARRTELIFYYSGHSDENGILLARERYSYRDLRERINTIAADMKIIILDSCSSGAITRVKGGVKTQPFLFDSSVSAAGFAFLTSSSDNEASQESDSIESSYFTHSLLAGLRGAADSKGDGRVTLNELYRYAYDETLAKTETSVYGAQHPNYDIQISGSGDVVLTDIKEISSSLLFVEDLAGLISIRDSSGFLIAELTKASRRNLELGLEPGFYSIILQQGERYSRTEVRLPENQRTTVNAGNFYAVAAARGSRIRGGTPDLGFFYPDVQAHPVSLQLLPVPGLDVFGNHGWEGLTNNFLFALFIGKGHNIRGAGIAPLGLINTGHVNGIQISGGSNITDELYGLQIGLVNINEDGFGGMAGLVNISGSEKMIPLGLVNIIKNGIMHMALYYDDMQFINTSFRSGSKYFYSVMSFGLGSGFSYSRLGTEKEGRNIPFGFRMGLGFEFPIKNFFMDFDISGGVIYVLGKKKYGYDDELAGYTVPLGQLRLIGGYRIFEHLGIFAGLTFSIYNFPLIPDRMVSDYNVKSGNYFSNKWGFVAGVQF